MAEDKDQRRLNERDDMEWFRKTYESERTPRREMPEPRPEPKQDRPRKPDSGE